MGKVRVVCIVFWAAGLLMLAGCGGSSVKPTTSDSAAGVAWWDADNADLFPIRVGAQAVECSGGWPTLRQASAATGSPAMGLPAPAALADGPGAMRQASYAETDLYRAGAQYDPGLSNSRVSSVSAPSLIFSPVWGIQDPPELSDAAYCIYRFSLSDYDTSGRPQTLALAWSPGSAPTDYANLWLGLANQQTNRWDWFNGPADNVLTLASFSPYMAGNGAVLAAVVLLGSDSCALLSLKVGEAELRALGAHPDFPDRNPAPPPPGGGLPASCDLSPDCSPVGDQGQIASCTSFAAARGALDYELGQVYGADGWDFADPFNLAGTKYLYLQTGAECGAFAYRETSDVVAYLASGGDSSELNCPYVNICDRDWGQSALDDAALLNADAILDLDPRGAVGVSRLKTALAEWRKVLVFQTGVDWAFFDLGPDEVWNYSGAAIAGHQALCLVGYDDSKQAFKVRNSWGGGWAGAGYCWIGYQTFGDGDPALGLWAWALNVDYDPAAALRFCGQQQALAPPTGVQASDGAYTDKIRISWTRSSGATGYKVYRDQQDNVVATLGDTALWDDAGITDYFAHAYWVQATGPGGDSALSPVDTGYIAQTPAILDVQPQGGFPGEVVTFSATVQGSSPLHYYWDFGGSAAPNLSNVEAPQVTLGAQGMYSASLTLSNDFGSDVFAFTLAVVDEGNHPPVAALQLEPPTGDAGDTITLNAGASYDIDPGDSIVKYEYDFGEGAGWQDYGAASSAAHQYNSDGSYTLRVRVSDSAAAMDEASGMLRIGAPVPNLLTLPRHVDRAAVPGYIQIFFDEPRLRRDGRLLMNQMSGTAQPIDSIGYSDQLKLNGSEFPIGFGQEFVGGNPVFVPYPRIVIQETTNPDNITGLDDPDAIADITIPFMGGRESGRIMADITMLLLNLPPAVPGNVHSYCYKLYAIDGSEIGWGEFEVPDDPVALVPPVGVEWGVNVGSRGAWDKSDFNALCTSKVVDGNTILTPAPDMFWVRFNSGTRLLDWDEYWGDGDANSDNLQLVFVDEEANAMTVPLLPELLEVGAAKDYVLVHHFNTNNGSFYSDWSTGGPGGGILTPGHVYMVYLDDPSTAGWDWTFPDLLSVIGNNPNG